MYNIYINFFQVSYQLHGMLCMLPDDNAIQCLPIIVVGTPSYMVDWSINDNNFKHVLYNLYFPHPLF